MVAELGLRWRKVKIRGHCSVERLQSVAQRLANVHDRTIGSVIARIADEQNDHVMLGHDAYIGEPVPIASAVCEKQRHALLIEA